MPNDSTATADLPKVKRGRRKGLDQHKTFAEIIRRVGNEKDTYTSIEGSKREILVRMMYDLILQGQVVFPDGRIMSVDYEEWRSLAWDLITHLDIVAVNAAVKESGALVGSSLMTQVVLYMPDNQRQVQTVFADPAAQEIVQRFPSVGQEAESNLLE